MPIHNHCPSLVRIRQFSLNGLALQEDAGGVGAPERRGPVQKLFERGQGARGDDLSLKSGDIFDPRRVQGHYGTSEAGRLTHKGHFPLVHLDKVDVGDAEDREDKAWKSRAGSHIQ